MEAACAGQQIERGVEGRPGRAVEDEAVLQQGDVEGPPVVGHDVGEPRQAGAEVSDHGGLVAGVIEEELLDAQVAYIQAKTRLVYALADMHIAASENEYVSAQ